MTSHAGSIALLLGGTGQIGRAAARRLAEDGWNVVVASRGSPPADMVDVQWQRLDRNDTDALRTLAEGASVLVDVVAYTSNHAEQLVQLAGHIGSLIVISSAAVYESGQRDLPLREDAATVDEGSSDYAARKRAIELRLLSNAALRATLVRAGAIHGPHSPHPREWYFVKRVLDGRGVIVLPHRGERIFHPVAARNLAELIALAARRPATRIINGGDPSPPTLLGIARIISRLLDHEWAEVLLPAAPEGGVGDNPWNAEQDLVLDMGAAEVELGYVAPVDYPTAVAAEVEWLLAAARKDDWHTFIRDHRYLEPLFDYAAEDAFVGRLSSSACR